MLSCTVYNGWKGFGEWDDEDLGSAKPSPVLQGPPVHPPTLVYIQLKTGNPKAPWSGGMNHGRERLSSPRDVRCKRQLSNINGSGRGAVL